MIIGLQRSEYILSEGEVIEVCAELEGYLQRPVVVAANSTCMCAKRTEQFLENDLHDTQIIFGGSNWKHPVYGDFT